MLQCQQSNVFCFPPFCSPHSVVHEIKSPVPDIILLENLSIISQSLIAWTASQTKFEKELWKMCYSDCVIKGVLLSVILFFSSFCKTTLQTPLTLHIALK